MLVELRVENLGIVDDLALVLPAGLVAITGETGAGKTLIVEAVELLVGGRADPGLVRAGQPEARVEGRFEIDGDEHVLSRVVPADDRSRAYLDGRLVTAGELSALGRRLVDLHGQHTHQSLLAPATQRAALDAFAGAGARDALGEYQAAREAIREIDAELGALGGDERTRAREVDLLRFQLDEIESAEIVDPMEDEGLSNEVAVLADAEAHREALAVAVASLDTAARDAFGDVASALDDRPPFAAFAARAESLRVELDELVRDLRAASEGMQANPERLDALQHRRGRLADLRRKYGATLEQVLAFGMQARARLDDLESSEERRSALLDRRARHEADATSAAVRLHEVRRAASGPLAEAVAGHLVDLALPHARFEVGVEKAEPGEDGADAIELGFTANPGEPPRPLAKVASGGELSRTMLALRVVLTAGPPTLLFDEVDAGIGGEAGSAVGRLLARLGETHQVLCITHLAQVAAFADAQVVVDKRVAGDRTVADARTVVDTERVVELSRMLAGVGESRHARDHAAELLAAAETMRS